jgi:hypothetical protein
MVGPWSVRVEVDEEEVTKLLPGGYIETQSLL